MIASSNFLISSAIFGYKEIYMLKRYSIEELNQHIWHVTINIPSTMTICSNWEQLHTWLPKDDDSSGATWSKSRHPLFFSRYICWGEYVVICVHKAQVLNWHVSCLCKIYIIISMRYDLYVQEGSWQKKTEFVLSTQIPKEKNMVALWAESYFTRSISKNKLFHGRSIH